jgi:hypothetical protein
MAVIISLPFVVLMPVIVYPADIRSVKIIPVIISSPINISLGIAIVVATIRVSRSVKTGA